MKLSTAFVAVLAAAHSSPASAQMKRLRKDESASDVHKYTQEKHTVNEKWSDPMHDLQARIVKSASKHTVEEEWGRAMHNLQARTVKSPSKHTVDEEWGRTMQDLQARTVKSARKSGISSKVIQEAIAAVASNAHVTCDDSAGCADCYECVYKVEDVYVCAPDPSCTSDDDQVHEPTFQCVVAPDRPGDIFPVCPGMAYSKYCDGDGDCGSSFCACEAGLAFCDTQSNPCSDNSNLPSDDHYGDDLYGPDHYGYGDDHFISYHYGDDHFSYHLQPLEFGELE
jgi:hypothetical protein